MADLALLALFAGLYSVPMYALIQMRSQPSHRARIIAANNILNALFMIVSAGMAALLLKAGVTMPQLFLITGLLNAVVAVYIFLLVPEYLLRFIAWVATRLIYRFKVRGDEHIPIEGAAHPGVQPRQLRRRGAADGGQPAADRLHHGPPHLQLPVLGTLFRLAKAIPIAPQKEDPAGLRAGLRTRPRRCSTTATCCASSPRARSRATASSASSRAA